MGTIMKLYRLSNSHFRRALPQRREDAQGVRALCTYNGNINTTGRTGSISGTYSCSGGANNVGSFTITNLESSINGFNGNFQGSDQFCSNIGGRFGGVKDVL